MGAEEYEANLISDGVIVFSRSSFHSDGSDLNNNTEEMKTLFRERTLFPLLIRSCDMVS